ncbi:hypothetical protein TPHA_0N00980 [Tetrapisispora phaffii CBS 4417]|uniref:Vps53 N-terminal domain-containing protein n=1 Tax=Tetrapisispora phaffii (strain ATCC 24235 / CBS 4417 / NBRC 1672 / NRRL Y-8282 / UCD 70-5) TaxID=1071381 RepID=G8C151_TETPH|nr:hypothetical protein TPHA_0N00980 [Tetrapisispora phaffii CBS 4417]CCE65879.1 hypothetical protein TPHA_0N00980 [Tetrapisispora phaffii CBS 4417]
MISNTLNYNPIEDITNILVHREALDNIDELINTTASYRASLMDGSSNADPLSAESAASPHSGPPVLDIVSIFNEFEGTKVFAKKSQDTISNLIKDISHLDNAKKNITHSMTFLQHLKILMQSYTVCSMCLKNKSFDLEMSSNYKIMCSLADSTFDNYKSVDEIVNLLRLVKVLKADISTEIINVYKKILAKNPGAKDDSSRISNNLSTDLKQCIYEILETDNATKSKLMDFCIDKLLYEIKEIFQLDDEAGSLDNLPRRYIFFKKILNNYKENLSEYFPDDWEIQLKLTGTFYSWISTDLKVLLKKEFNDANPSIDLFMTVLQDTLEFERYIDLRFSRKVKVKKISTAFEPYSSLWIKNQDKLMDEKFLTYLSENKIPDNLNNQSLVIQSSADLFRTYRSILSQSFELMGNGSNGEGNNTMNDHILKSLAIFFSKWLNEYSKKLLTPLILPEREEIKNKEEAIKYTLLMINTTDYCSRTISQLEEKLLEFSQNKNEISNIFVPIKNVYGNLLASGNNTLLTRILPLDLVYVWREFNNTNWSNILVEDYSRYMITLKNTLTTTEATSTNTDDIESSAPEKTKQTTIELILKYFNRDVYSWNFLDRLIDSITNSFIGCIIKLLQPQPPFIQGNTIIKRKLDSRKVVLIGEQLLLDSQLLKDIFNNLVLNMETDSLQNTSSKRVKKHINNNIDQILSFVKLIMVPMNSPEDYCDNYNRLTNKNTNPIVWAFLFCIKGIEWDLNVWKSYWKVFTLDVNERDSQEIIEERGDKSKTATKTPANNSEFIFTWQPALLSNFQNNLYRIEDEKWLVFIKQQMKIPAPKRSIASRHVR